MRMTRQIPAAADIVSALYEAALAPSRWEDALAKIGARCGADSVILYRAQLRGEEGAMLSGLPGSALLRRRFVAEAPLNPFIPRLAKAPLFKPQGDRDMIPRRELERTAFFRAWVEPFEMSDGLMTSLAPIGPDAAVLTLIRKGRGPHAFEEPAIRRLTGILPHLRRALQVQRELMARTTLPEAASLFLLDKLALPAMVLSGEGRLLWGNEAGMQLARAGASVTLARDGSLEARTAQGRRALAGLLAAALGSGDDDSGGGGGCCCAKLDRGNGLPLIILALPLDGGGLGAAGQLASGAVTLLFLDGAAQIPSGAAA
jgi:hypothetical protein